MDRERVIQRITVALATLEKCSVQEIEGVKWFLRWMPDGVLQDIWDKHSEALGKRRIPIHDEAISKQGQNLFKGQESSGYYPPRAHQSVPKIMLASHNA